VDHPAVDLTYIGSGPYLPWGDEGYPGSKPNLPYHRTAITLAENTYPGRGSYIPWKGTILSLEGSYFLWLGFIVSLAGDHTFLGWEPHLLW
jgi:hypothetical protein